jgi:hypothetical protein
VDFSGSSLEKSIFSPFARKIFSHIHDYLGKRISIISLLLHKVSPYNVDSIPYIKYKIYKIGVTSGGFFWKLS